VRKGNAGKVTCENLEKARINRVEKPWRNMHAVIRSSHSFQVDPLKTDSRRVEEASEMDLVNRILEMKGRCQEDKFLGRGKDGCR
jgi:hypothetical protein